MFYPGNTSWLPEGNILLQTLSIRGRAHRYLHEIDLGALCCACHVDLVRAEKRIATLGGRAFWLLAFLYLKIAEYPS